MGSANFDVLFMRSLVRTLSCVALEVAIARGRLKRGYLAAKSYLAEARGHVTRTRGELEQLGQAVWGEGFRDAPSPQANVALEDALDVLHTRRWVWSLRFAGEGVTLARSMLGRSKRQRVTAAMLGDVCRSLTKASNGLDELQQRAWDT